MDRKSGKRKERPIGYLATAETVICNIKPTNIQVRINFWFITKMVEKLNIDQLGRFQGNYIFWLNYQETDKLALNRKFQILSAKML